jgi:hypothetical protein
MNPRITPIVLVPFLFYLVSCSSTFQISSDYDRKADFSMYESFNFVPDSGLTAPGTQKMRSLIKDYMPSLGYVTSDEPDLYIGLNSRVQEKMGVTSTPTYGYGGYYGYYGWDSYTRTYVYKESTVVVDIIDVDETKLVWQGAATGEFDQYNLTEGKMEKMVNDIMGQYPFQAGTNEPRKLMYNKYYAKPK